MEQNLTHFDAQGNAIMVDVSEKASTVRIAVATGKIRVNQQVMDAIKNKAVAKGDVLTVAQVAGIMAVKQTHHLIPMCHPLNILNCGLTFEMTDCISATCTVKIKGETGVEMEALTGVTVALLTIYDMCKAMDKTMELGEIYLLEKSGGKSGAFYHAQKGK